MFFLFHSTYLEEREKHRRYLEEETGQALELLSRGTSVPAALLPTPRPPKSTREDAVV